MGYSAAEWAADPEFWITRLHPDDRERALAADATFVSTGKPMHSEHRLLARDNHPVWIQEEAVLVSDAAGQPLYVLGIMLDITARKEAEEIQSRLVALADASSDAIIGATLDGTITSWTTGAERLYGYTAEEALGQILPLVSDVSGTVEEVRTLRAALVRGETISDFEMVHRRKDGRPVPLSLSLAPMRDTAGAIIGMAMIARDITARKQADEALRFLGAIVASSDDAIIGKTLDGIIVSWNGGAEAIYGYTAAEVMGRSIALLVPPDRPDELPWILERLRAGESIARYETQRRCKDGRQIDVSLTISPIRDEQGQITGASTIARDITAARRAELTRQFQAHLLNSVGQGVIAVDREEKITFWNHAAEVLFGWSAAEVLGHPIVAVAAAPSGRATAAEIGPHASSGQTWSGEVLSQRRDGTTFPTLVTVSPVYDETGALIGSVAVSTDITAQKAAEEQVRLLTLTWSTV